MGKKLLLVRHAKSDWADAGLKDFDRPLNHRGLKNAPEMADRIKTKHLIPKQLISSPANRAFTTAKLMANEWSIDESEIGLNSNIYEASCKTLLDILNNFDDDLDYIALFGHNNGITDFAVYLTDADIYNIPTCGMVLIEFPFESWKMVSKNTGELIFFDYPKNHT